MLLSELLKIMADCEVVNINLHNNRLIIGTVAEVFSNKRMKKYLNNEILSCYSVGLSTAKSETIIILKSRKADRKIIKDIKKGIIEDISSIYFTEIPEYFSYVNITLSNLFSFDIITKDEYNYLTKYLYSIDCDILCKRGVDNE